MCLCQWNKCAIVCVNVNQYYCLGHTDQGIDMQYALSSIFPFWIFVFPDISIIFLDWLPSKTFVDRKWPDRQQSARSVMTLVWPPLLLHLLVLSCPFIQYDFRNGSDGCCASEGCGSSTFVDHRIERATRVKVHPSRC